MSTSIKSISAIVPMEWQFGGQPWWLVMTNTGEMPMNFRGLMGRLGAFEVDIATGEILSYEFASSTGDDTDPA